ncbi:hypothetical protein PHYBOEH_000715 [Phytophthora boehmeriae]|uniref:Ankyrin repeat protein n=1 Tax=Phytophthora boehmeriae TaxID=109152 RepID=A0A8T1WVF5_9STRA|nr:hypothetical protein PHYBOEH_000715 [Phytophthora boehmeriae]
MDLQHEETKLLFARLKDVRFPDEIAGLVHILEEIDELLMSPTEALAKAVKAGKLEWLAFLLDTFEFDPLNSVASAAANGQRDSVVFLLSQAGDHENPGDSEESLSNDDEDSESDDDEDSESDDDDSSEDGRLDDRTRRVIEEATTMAASNGHIAVVEFLLFKIAGGREDDVYATMWRALDEAAANGHLSLVQFAIEHATQWGYAAIYSAATSSDALSRAISGGHDHVTKFLLDQPHFRWKMKSAFELAIANERQEIVEWIYAVYSQFVDGGNLLVDLIRDDQMNAVEYLLRILPHIIDQAFRTANIALVKFLYTNYNISAESIRTAFRSAALCGIVDGVNYCPSEDQQEIVKFLSKSESIAPRDIRTTFASASSYQLCEIVRCLRDDRRVPSQMVVRTFKGAIKCGDLDMVMASYGEQRIPAEILREAINNASSKGNIDIVEFLFENTATPDNIKQEAMVSAAGHNQLEVVQLMCNDGDWPREVLNEALNVTSDSKLKEYLQAKVNTT